MDGVTTDTKPMDRRPGDELRVIVFHQPGAEKRAAEYVERNNAADAHFEGVLTCWVSPERGMTNDRP